MNASCGIGTTSGILPTLPQSSTNYVFTDVNPPLHGHHCNAYSAGVLQLSDAFLRRARKRWQRLYPFVSYAIFNAEQDPAQQGFAPNSFDAVIAVNVSAFTLPCV